MAIIKTVHKYERVVPVRFARAPHATDPTVASGTYDANAPEPDDRGFLPHTTGGAVLPVGLDEAVAAAARPETRVRLIRMDMENTGQLFVTSENTGIFEITLPASNAALPSTREMMIKLRAIATGSAHLQVRFGAIDGPIIHQMQVVVNPLIQVRLVAHVPTINGNPVPNPAAAPPGTPFPAQSTITNLAIQTMVNNANQIYFPYGIRLNLDAAINRAGVIALTNQGMVDDLTEFNQLTALNRVARAINAYFVPQIANPTAPAPNTTPINLVAGVATSARGNPTTYGLFVAERVTNAHTIAHEIGHLFNIVNDPTNEFLHINTRTDPAIPGTGRVVRFDTISRRRLMWAFTGINLGASAQDPNRGLHNLPFRNDVGYGANLPGAMLTIKGLSNDKTDTEMAEVRRTSAALP
jgi:hypothetical protein